MFVTSKGWRNKSEAMMPIMMKDHERPLTYIIAMLISYSPVQRITPQSVWFADNGERMGTYMGNNRCHLQHVSRDSVSLITRRHGS